MGVNSLIVMTKVAMWMLPKELTYTVNCELYVRNEFDGRRSEQRRTDWVYFDVIAYEKPRIAVPN